MQVFVKNLSKLKMGQNQPIRYSKSSGLGGNPYRDGSFEYYIE
jgi:hypothetical protein